MTSFLMVTAIFLVVYRVANRPGLLPAVPERKVAIATIMVLAGAHSTASRAGAADVAQNPIVFETAIRGAAGLLALLLISGPALRAIRNFRRPHWAEWGLFLYIAVAATSTVYSAAPIVTAGKAFELGVGLVIVLAAVRGGTWSAESFQGFVGFVLLLEIGLLIVAIGGFVLAIPSFHQVGRPGFLFEATMASPYAHSNGLSSIGAFTAAYAFARYFTSSGSRRYGQGWLAIGWLGVLGVILASGRQGVVILLAALLVLLWTYRRKYLLFAGVPALIVVALVAWPSIYEALARGQSQGNLTTLTGRTILWGSAIEVWSAHPWLGYGFGAGGRFIALASIGEDRISSLHSGYMEALTGVGLVGVIPLGLAVSGAVWWSVGSLKTKTSVPEAILIVPLILRTLVSTGFGGWLSGPFLIFAALVFAVGARGRRVNQSRSARTRNMDLVRRESPRRRNVDRQ